MEVPNVTKKIPNLYFCATCKEKFLNFDSHQCFTYLNSGNIVVVTAENHVFPMKESDQHLIHPEGVWNVIKLNTGVDLVLYQTPASYIIQPEVVSFPKTSFPLDEEIGSGTVSPETESLGLKTVQESNTSKDEESKNEKVSKVKNVYIWSKEETIDLLNHYKKFRKLYESRKILNKNDIPEYIAKEMKIPADKISNKIKSLERSYKNWEDNKKGTGTGRMEVELLRELKEVFGKRHSIHSKCLIAASSDILPEKSINQSDENSKVSEDEEFEISQISDDNKIVATDSSEKERVMERERKERSDKGLKRRHTLCLKESREAEKKRMHKENLEKKDEYLKLKRASLKMKAVKYQLMYGKIPEEFKTDKDLDFIFKKNQLFDED